MRLTLPEPCQAFSAHSTLPSLVQPEASAGLLCAPAYGRSTSSVTGEAVGSLAMAAHARVLCQAPLFTSVPTSRFCCAQGLLPCCIKGAGAMSQARLFGVPELWHLLASCIVSPSVRLSLRHHTGLGAQAMGRPQSSEWPLAASQPLLLDSTWIAGLPDIPLMPELFGEM